MSCLIYASNSEGCTGKCDANCHNASTPASQCDCICGGMNHGVGAKRAQENTAKYVDDWIERWEKRFPDQKVHVHADKVFQLNLF